MKTTAYQLLGWALLLAFAWAAADRCGAQALSTASIQNPFESSEASARSMGMGGAFVGVADDSSALFFNPAGLGNLRGIDLAVDHQIGLAGITEDLLILGLPLGQGYGLGISGQFVNYGSFDGRTADGTPTASPTAYQAGFALGGGMELVPGFFMGAGLQGTVQQLSLSSYTLFNGNAGLLYVIPGGWRLGASYGGWGTAAVNANAPAILRAGVSKLFSGKGPFSLLAAASYDYESQFGSDALVGLEGAYRKNFFVRVGFQGNLQDSGINGFQGLTAGAGLAFADFSLDYAFEPFGDVGTTNRVSLAYRFGTEPTPAAPVSKIPTTRPVIQTTAPNPGQPQPVQSNPAGTGQSLTVQFDLVSQDMAKAQTLEQEGRSKDAVRAYLAVIKDDPQNAKAWWRLGNLYYHMNYKAYAVQCFETVLKLKPDIKTLADWLEKYKASPENPASNASGVQTPVIPSTPGPQ